MKKKIMVAHESAPEDYRHEFNIEFLGGDDRGVIDDIVALLNEELFCDCRFKCEDAPQDAVVQNSSAPNRQMDAIKHVVSAWDCSSEDNLSTMMGLAVAECKNVLQRH
jgi:hypothetical protein